jgi:uncharacterized membrane protein (UPF0127 family)
MVRGVALAGMLASLMLPGCEDFLHGKNDLSSMKTDTVSINGHEFAVWLAINPLDQQRGLMYVTEDELGPDQGMLFIFAREQPRSFWMANTPQDLDIAYIRTDGTIVNILTMRAYDRGTYLSVEPARYALEVRAGRFAELGIHIGDRAVLPR